ncbi:cytochrome C assembly protein [Moraxella caviae]|uniref:Cytochrome C assembly protein n=1 Tax=Moraxella caviae TaxID=34060 RepID=A0A1S9ZZ53_9GAMM|nr:cytochrome c biogenesis protein CcsA [Moraxella caviae]OOR88782.1 cytochrome C assembly protein [Moraxella caviae]STZ14874.1 Inner membrane protein ypjD [Moraxella caviae]VEW13672.1 Inner membrane protein ypjD [Moraxella caviae]
MLIVYLLTVLFYLGIGVNAYCKLVKKTPIKRPVLLGMLICGAILHGFLIVPQIITLHGLNFNIYNTLSLISLFFLVFFIIFSLYRPILSLGVLAAPTALIGVSIGYFGDVFGKAHYQPLTELSTLLQVHILLSFAAYCVLLMAAVQAIILRLQIRELKHKTIHRFWVSKLPSLQSMESLLFDMILLGFVILSIALGLGLLATYDVVAQHVAHKLLFSALSWVVFGVFIAGHYLAGWRGKRAANFAIYGFILLAIGFVGSKFVLEFLV